MKKIDLKDYLVLEKLLVNVKNGQPLTIADDKEEKYMVITTEDYDQMQERAINASFPYRFHPDINIISPDDLDLSDEDFEELKKLVLEALEGKMNKSNTTKS